MVDKAALGKEGEPFELVVERGKIHEFAKATKSEHPDYLTAENPVCPPTFLTTAFFWEEKTEGSNPWHLVDMDPKRGTESTSGVSRCP